MLDELLDIFERDKKKSSSGNSGGLRSRLAKVLDGGHDADRRFDDRRYDDRSRERDRDDDRYRARDRDDDDRLRSRERDDDDDRRRDRDDDDRYDDDRSSKHKKKREFDFLDFGD